jgi:hypothetical protein
VACDRGWFSPGTLVSSTNKTDCHDITEVVESDFKHHKTKPTQDHHFDMQIQVCANESHTVLMGICAMWVQNLA